MSSTVEVHVCFEAFLETSQETLEDIWLHDMPFSKEIWQGIIAELNGGKRMQSMLEYNASMILETIGVRCKEIREEYFAESVLARVLIPKNLSLQKTHKCC